MSASEEQQITAPEVESQSAYATLVLSDDYVAGARVVAHELRRTDHLHRILCLVARGRLSPTSTAQLGAAFDELVYVDAIDAGDSEELRLLQRPELRLTTTKLWLWALPYKRIVYLDADTLPLQSLSDLFEVPLPSSRHIGASPDTGWPDLFNSGVLILIPDRSITSELIKRLRAAPPIDGSDQGLLNEAFTWVRIPFLYNVTINTSYEYAPAFQRFQNQVKLLHFIGPYKPWNHHHQPPLLAGGGAAPGPSERWWAVFRNLNANAEPWDQQKVQEGRLVSMPPNYWDATTHAPFKGSRPEGEFLAEHLAAQLAQQLEGLHVEERAAEAQSQAPQEAQESAGLAQPDVHMFPVFGPTVVELPFERYPRRKRPERIF